MVDCENPSKVETNNVTLSNGNGSTTSGQIELEEREQLTEASIPSQADRTPFTCILANRLRTKWKKIMAWTVICALVVFTSVKLSKSSSAPCPATTALSCPSGWVGYEGRCYYFSKVEGTWYDGQSNCSASGASLLVIEDQNEMDIIMQLKRETDYWIGLTRKDGQPWEWANGSVFNGWFKIRADGFCAYLDDESASSTLCGTKRNWICGKSAHMSRTKL